MSQNRYGKEKQLRDVMLHILDRNPQGIDSSDFVSRVRKKTGASRAKIFAEIKRFDLDDKIEIKRPLKDRRKAIYKPDLQRIRADQKLSKAQQHIESLRNPVASEISVPKGPYTAYISVFGEGHGFDPEKERKSLEEMMMQTKKSMEESSIPFWQSETFDKVILFFMVERTK